MTTTPDWRRRRDERALFTEMRNKLQNGILRNHRLTAPDGTRSVVPTSVRVKSATHEYDSVDVHYDDGRMRTFMPLHPRHRLPEGHPFAQSSS